MKLPFRDKNGNRIDTTKKYRDTKENVNDIFIVGKIGDTKCLITSLPNELAPKHILFDYWECEDSDMYQALVNDNIYMCPIDLDMEKLTPEYSKELEPISEELVAPMERNLDGIYFRVQRDGKWTNRCFTDLTDKEQEDLLNNHKDNPTFLISLAKEIAQEYRMMASALNVVMD